MAKYNNPPLVKAVCYHCKQKARKNQMQPLIERTFRGLLCEACVGHYYALTDIGSINK